METIKLSNGKTVSKQDYISAKTKDLKEFGYNSLTEKEVAEQLEKIIDNRSGLNVIGLMMEADLKNPEE